MSKRIETEEKEVFYCDVKGCPNKADYNNRSERGDYCWLHEPLMKLAWNVTLQAFDKRNREVMIAYAKELFALALQEQEKKIKELDSK